MMKAAETGRERRRLWSPPVAGKGTAPKTTDGAQLGVEVWGRFGVADLLLASPVPDGCVTPV